MLEEIIDLGFQNVELGHGIRLPLAEGILKMWEAGRVKITSLHNFCPLPAEIPRASPDCYQFSAPHDGERDRAVRHSFKTIDFAKRLGAKFVVMHLGSVPYGEAWDLQRSLAGAVSQGAIPDTIVLLEHPPVVTLGRRTDETAELHVPEGAGVEVVETDRGGKSTFHGPGQLVCYPILDLTRHGQDVKKYCRDLETAIATMQDWVIRHGFEQT